MARALQFVDVAGLGHAFSVFGQTMSEHIGHQHHVHFLANGTHRLGRFSDVSSGANEFWMSITHRVFADPSFLHFVNE